jgi:hypothetical protein
VRITRFRVFPYLRAELRIDVVPRTAEMTGSVIVLSAKQGAYSEEIGHTIRVGRLDVKWRGCVCDGVHTLDRLVKCAVLGDILDNDELKAVTVVRKFIVEEDTFRQRADCAAHRIPRFEVLLGDPSGEITVCACDEDLGWGRNGDHAGQAWRGVARQGMVLSFYRISFRHHSYQ